MLGINYSIYLLAFTIGFIGCATIAWRKDSELALTLATFFEMLMLLEGFKII